MNALLWWAGQTFVVTTILAALVGALCPLFRHRPAVQHALWLIVLIKFLTPTLVSWPWEIPDLAAIGAARTPEGPTAADDLRFVRNARSTIAAPALAWDAHAMGWAAVAIWLAGALVYVTRRVWMIRAQAAVIQRGRNAPRALKHALVATAARMRLQPMQALVVRGIASPFVWCLGKLRLAWPSDLLGGSAHASRRSIIAHELAHVRRRDHWVAWLELAAAAVWWWNPLFWLVRRKLRASSELACDALALATFPDDRCEYAEMLLRLSAGSKSGAPALVLGVGTGTPSSLERRLSMIVSERASGKLSARGLFAAACLGLAALPGWSFANPDDGKKKQDVLYYFQAVEQKDEGEPNANRDQLVLFVPSQSPEGLCVQRLASDVFVSRLDENSGDLFVTVDDSQKGGKPASVTLEASNIVAYVPSDVKQVTNFVEAKVVDLDLGGDEAKSGETKQKFVVLLTPGAIDLTALSDDAETVKGEWISADGVARYSIHLSEQPDTKKPEADGVRTTKEFKGKRLRLDAREAGATPTTIDLQPARMRFRTEEAVKVQGEAKADLKEVRGRFITTPTEVKEVRGRFLAAPTAEVEGQLFVTPTEVTEVQGRFVSKPDTTVIVRGTKIDAPAIEEKAEITVEGHANQRVYVSPLKAERLTRTKPAASTNSDRLERLEKEVAKLRERIDSAAK